MKGFKLNEVKVDGKIVIDDNKKLAFAKAESSIIKKSGLSSLEMPPCPKCKQGKLLKGKAAYGCTRWKSGCDFTYSFIDIKKKAAGQKLSKALVLKIISG